MTQCSCIVKCYLMVCTSPYSANNPWMYPNSAAECDGSSTLMMHKLTLKLRLVLVNATTADEPRCKVIKNTTAQVPVR